MNTLPRYISGSDLKNCHTWPEVYEKLSSPPCSINKKHLEYIQTHCTDLRCTGCMEGKAVVIVDSKRKVNIALHADQEPSMRQLHEWEINKYERFCRNCKTDYVQVNRLCQNIETLGKKEIPDYWTKPELIDESEKGKWEDRLCCDVCTETHSVYAPGIEYGLYLRSGFSDVSYDFSDWKPHKKKSSYFLNLKRSLYDRMGYLKAGCDRDYFSFRKIVTQDFGMWGLVDKNSAQVLAETIKAYGIHTCLEVGAGNGWLCKALSDQGILVTATDEAVDKEKIVANVVELEARSAIQQYPEMDALLICWPHSNAGKMIADWPIGKWVIYIGEDEWGCNAASDFFAQIDFESYTEIPMPRWRNCNDFCRIGKKVKDWEAPHWEESDSEESDSM